MDNVRAALDQTRVKVSNQDCSFMIMQKILEGRVDSAVNFWKNDVGVDDVISTNILLGTITPF